ncbi:hypothetical protein HMPREF2534_00069 [Bacteroides thetaiotaomicron]|nr:hypothetical protein HMPREF9007_02668 [Bacteroides sp. 1_1_14]KXT45243.1 hypothetical protein HMPREF2534_00069 [Bacteroides thetaiotaomicron]
MQKKKGDVSKSSIIGDQIFHVDAEMFFLQNLCLWMSYRSPIFAMLSFCFNT